MYLADYHTHSAVSHDGRMRISEMAERYIAAGFDEFCVTDHMDTLDPRSPERNPSFPWAELERQYREAVETFGDRIRILHMKDYQPVEGAEDVQSMACGTGVMDYTRLLAFAQAHPGLPMTLEDTVPDNAVAAREHLENTAK